MNENEQPKDWLIATIGICASLALAIGIGYLIGTQSLSGYARLPDLCTAPAATINNTICVAARTALAAEQSAARAWWYNLISAGTLITGSAALASLVVTIRQGRRMMAVSEAANTISRETGQAQVRAYVTINHLDVLLDEFGQFTGSVELGNVGTSPARAVRWGYSAILVFAANMSGNVFFATGPGIDPLITHLNDDIASGSTILQPRLSGSGLDSAAINSAAMQHSLCLATVLVRIE